MIRQKQNFFLLETENTTYAFHILESGQAEHLYYGKRLLLPSLEEEGAEELWENALRAMQEKQEHPAGNSIAYSKDFPTLMLEDLCLEFSSLGKGDIREPFVELQFADGSSTCDFLFEKAEIMKEKRRMENLPSSYDETGKAMTLKLCFKERVKDVELQLFYSVFPQCDGIVKSAKLVNHSKETVEVRRLLSGQLDFDKRDFVFSDFTGHWAKEMNRNDHKISAGKHINAVLAGTSSNRANPFVMLSREQTGEESGLCIGCNLLYSGNHYEAMEVSGHGKSRFVQGMNPHGFSWKLKPGESFESPEAVTVLSEEGFQGMSLRMHAFVREHIVRGEWKRKARPVLVNSWEAAYFDINEAKLLKLAKKSKEAGAELFVMDDGWFGKRDNDTGSLGDWYADKRKLPNGVKGLAEKINDMGLLFGIWVEPEMVNEDSDCYRKHPEYAVQIPGRENSLGRNQMLLDLTKEEVQDFIIGQMEQVFESGNISYVKWDMNRIVSDAYSTSLSAKRQGEFFHRYMLGLYRVMGVLTEKFPHILFEGCASGGGRFDLGILCYFPQIWASDNTDACSRMKIQNGYSYGYPLSVLGAHVSNCPNHQTLRVTPLETRFHVAEFGLLGMEWNLCEMKKEEWEETKEQIAQYKRWREVFQFGEFYRLEEKKHMVVSPDKKKAVLLIYQDLAQANSVYERIYTKGLLEDTVYHVYNRKRKYNIKAFGDLVNTVAPIHIKQDSLLHNGLAKLIKMDGEEEDYKLSGSVLNQAGIKLKQAFGATGYNENTRFYPDFATRMYFMEAVEK